MFKTEKHEGTKAPYANFPTVRSEGYDAHSAQQIQQHAEHVKTPIFKLNKKKKLK